MCPGGVTVTVAFHCAWCKGEVVLQAGEFLHGFPTRGECERRLRGWRKRRNGGWRCGECDRWERGCFREGQQVHVRVFSEVWAVATIRRILPPGTYPPRVELDYPNGRWNRLSLADLTEVQA